MNEIKVWILIMAVSVIATVLGFVIKTVTHQVIKKLDEIVSELKQLTKTSAVQEQQIKELAHRLNDHSARLRSIELNSKH